MFSQLGIDLLDYNEESSADETEVVDNGGEVKTGINMELVEDAPCNVYASGL